MIFVLYIAQVLCIVALVGVEPGKTQTIYRLKCHRESVGLYHFRRFFCEVGMPKRGDVNTETGLVFWDRSHGRERWIDCAKFDSWKIRADEARKSAHRQQKSIEYRLKNKENLYARRREYYNNNKQSERQYNKKYVNENKERLAKLRKEYRRANPLPPEKAEEIRIKTRAYTVARRANDLNFRLTRVLRSRLNMAFRNGRGSKAASTTELLGTSIDAFRKHIESMWTDGMTWENYGVNGWHLDHIIPCAAFDITTIDGQQKCFHYSNIQPLWACDNARKSSTYNGVHIRARSPNQAATL